MDLQTYLSQKGEPLFLARGEHLFRQGDSDASLYYVRKGFLKAYYLTANGREQIKSFIETGNVVGSLSAAHLKEENTFSLQCLDDVELLRFSFDEIRVLSENTLTVAKWLNQLLLGLAVKKERREYEFLCLSAEDRYLALQERSPDLLARVTQQDIALYLGITPVALSRIKKRLSDR